MEFLCCKSFRIDQTRHIPAKGTKVIVSDQNQSIDIDTLQDFELAQDVGATHINVIKKDTNKYERQNVVRNEPNRLFIEVIGRYDWLFEKLVDYGEKHHSVSHFIIVSSDFLKQKYQALLRQNDSIVTTVAELELNWRVCD